MLFSQSLVYKWRKFFHLRSLIEESKWITFFVEEEILFWATVNRLVIVLLLFASSVFTKLFKLRK